MTDYAVHTFDGEEWSLDSLFDERELAIYEAHTLLGKRIYDNVRVVSLTKTDVGDAVKETIYIGSAESHDTKEIVKHVDSIKRRGARTPPGVVLIDPEVE